jgi:aryl-alcohol dehydrogenase-like predicted oxidoreductase
MLKRVDGLIAQRRAEDADVEVSRSAIARHAAASPMLGRAAAMACRDHVDRAAGLDPARPRPSPPLGASAVGIGTHRGAADDRADAISVRAISACLAQGVNRIDTASHYRAGRAERCVGAAVRAAVAAGRLRREAVLVSSKAGFAHAPDGALVHRLDPVFLRDQLDASRERLGMETIDIFYLHNPEVGLRCSDSRHFWSDLGKAIEALEGFAARGLIGEYGIATWDGLWRHALDMERIVDLARRIAGDGHRLRHLQTPLDMTAPQTGASRQTETFRRARACGLSVVVSAALQWGRTLRRVTRAPADPTVGWAERSVLRCLAEPGVSAALVGMRRTDHIDALSALAIAMRQAGYR